MSVSTILLYAMAIIYIAAGANHFLQPKLYERLIPPYFPAISMLNYLSGLGEIIGGALLFFPATRNYGIALIIFLLIAFMPAHIYMIQKAPFNIGKIKITLLIAWIRIPLQVLLIWWAYQYWVK